MNKKTSIRFLAELTRRWEERALGEARGPLCLMWLVNKSEVRREPGDLGKECVCAGGGGGANKDRLEEPAGEELG